MKALFKYAIVLMLGLAIGSYVRWPLNLEDVAKFKWFDEINITINKAFALARPQAAVPLVDPTAAARVDEDLDYRIAQRKGSVEGWRSFLAAHGSGVHAQSAKAEVEKLLLAGQAPAPAAAEVSNGATADAKTGSEVVRSAPPDPGAEAAALTPDEVCKRDGDRLERLRSRPTNDEALRFAGELGCEKLRPQLVSLMESLGYAAPPPAAAEVSNGASADAKTRSEVGGSAPPDPGTGAAALTPDEVCKRDGDRLERLRSRPTSDEARRLAGELGCEKLRPQLLGLIESLGYAAPAPAAAPTSPSARASSALAERASSALGPKRAASPPRGTHPTASSRSLRSGRHPKGCAFKSVCFSKASLPPILLALVGARPKNSGAFRVTATHARPNDLRGR